MPRGGMFRDYIFNKIILIFRADGCVLRQQTCRPIGRRSNPLAAGNFLRELPFHDEAQI